MHKKNIDNKIIISNIGILLMVLVNVTVYKTPKMGFGLDRSEWSIEI